MSTSRSLAYNLIMYLLSPLWLLVTISQAVKRKGGWRFIAARMGWWNTTAESAPSTASNRPLWIHAASVGEVNSALPLLKYLGKTWPTIPIQVTCTTPESLTILRKYSADADTRISCRYIPIDFKSSVERLFRHLNPLALIVIETEIWPNLYTQANTRQVPLIIVNGRLSNKTLNAPQFVLNTYRQVLPCVSLVLSRSKVDTANFKKLGVDDHLIRTVGNIKNYAGDKSPPAALPELSGKRYLLAASTHAPEEQQLCDAIAATNLLLVIAPRHVQRSSAIQRMLEGKNITFSTRSRHEPVTTATQVYLADTTGEMERLIVNADIVFVGGSLTAKGGHNVLEPAIQGKPVFTGPHYDNFTAEVDLLSRHKAIGIVDSAIELISAYTKLINHPEQLTIMGNSAKQAVESSKHVFDQYTAELDTLIETWR